MAGSPPTSLSETKAGVVVEGSVFDAFGGDRGGKPPKFAGKAKLGLLILLSEPERMILHEHVADETKTARARYRGSLAGRHGDCEVTSIGVEDSVAGDVSAVDGKARDHCQRIRAGQ